MKGVFETNSAQMCGTMQTLGCVPIWAVSECHKEMHDMVKRFVRCALVAELPLQPKTHMLMHMVHKTDGPYFGKPVGAASGCAYLHMTACGARWRC